MTFRNTIIAIFLSGAVLSCVAPTEELRSSVTTNSITLSLEQTRTQLGEKVAGVYPLYWSEGDKISVDGVVSESAIIDPNNPAYATFLVNGVVGDTSHIAYPATAEGKVVFTENQTHTANSTFGQGVTTMYGVGNELHHLTGVLKIGIVGSATLQKVRITSADHTPIAGVFDIDFQSGKIAPTSESSSVINYSFGSGVKLNPSTPTFVHIALPAGEYPSLNLRIYDNEGGVMSKTVKAPSSKPLVAGNIREFTTPVNYKADSTSDVVVGKPLPLWSEGYLDIHMINSGSGECAFYVMPDGTTMIVDVGELSPDFGDTRVPKRPNDVVRPYKTYANYIKHFMPEGKSEVDYLHISHFHNDHFGDPGIKGETNPTVGYRRIGPMALYDQIPFKNILDRGYPDYVEDSKTAPIDHTWLIEDWKKLIKWGEENGKLQGARFEVGQEQIKLLYNKAKYSNFYTMNICGNGYGYYIKSGATKPAKVGSKSDGGNPSSCGFYLRYGDFDYVSAGDVTSAPQNRMAYYFRDCADGHKLDAIKGGHHLSNNSYGGQMVTYMFPDVILNQNFYKTQPDIALLNEKIFPIIESEVFTTNAHPDALTENPDTYAKISGYNGHIVLRVAPGGCSYYVYMLDATDFDYRVKSVHGPYTSK